MRTCWALIRIGVALALGMMLLASSASAMSCRSWLRLNAAQKEVAVHVMIDDSLESNRARQYSVNREAIGRCLRSNAPRMAIDFDDLCSDSRSADMQAIPKRFKSYVWSCAG